MRTMKKTPTRIKFDGLTFIHTALATPQNHDHMAYINTAEGVKYYLMKREAVSQPDTLTEKHLLEGLFEKVVVIPTKEEIAALERKDMVVGEDGELSQVEQRDKPKVIEHPSGKKMKRRFLNPKTGNYVSYIRAIQLKLVSEYAN